jgi:hypothetical protein
MATLANLNPNTIEVLNALLGGGGSGTAGSPTAPSAQVRALIDAIPFANDGDVITADHHNTLREAIARIAGSVGDTQLARVSIESFAPQLLPVANGEAPWRTSPRFAVGPTTGFKAEGWMPLDLPHGADIDSMIVRGLIPLEVGGSPLDPREWNAKLVRLELAGHVEEVICNGELMDAPRSPDLRFVATLPAATAAGLTPAQASGLRRIDTSSYRYYFHTRLAFLPAQATELRLVQVRCTRE